MFQKMLASAEPKTAFEKTRPTFSESRSFTVTVHRAVARSFVSGSAASVRLRLIATSSRSLTP